jgi:site-specific DNA-methyltransferase (adenine-specific)
MNVCVYHDDCLERLPTIDSRSIDLVYADPPFFTGKVHRLSTRDRTREFHFNDLWSSHEEYATFLFERVRELHRVLKETGSIFLHCDRNATHIVRTILDSVFGSDTFRSEIIWHYRRWSNSQKGLLPAHQTIYFYSKSDHFTFNRVFEEYSPSTNLDQILQRRSRDKAGKAVYDRDTNGKTKNAGPKQGVPLSDVWDIPYLNPKARERTGYPTQKPVLLLDRIIRLCSNPGDLVLDPFCGSGTTLIAARELGRDSIGIDKSVDAIQLTESRIKTPIITDSRLLQDGRESYRQANNKLIALLYGLKLHPVHRNAGIDAILQEQICSSPVPVRIQRPTESLGEAADKLIRASRGKHSQLMVLVTTHRSGQRQIDEDIPDNVIVVESPALLIQHRLMLAAN